MQDDTTSDSSSRTLSDKNKADQTRGDNLEETSDEELSNSDTKNEGSSSHETDSSSTEDQQKPKVTEGKATLSLKSQLKKSQAKIAEAAREIAEEEAAKAKDAAKAKEAEEAKLKATTGAEDLTRKIPARSPRVKSVAVKRMINLVVEESSDEDISDTSPLKQRRRKHTHDPLHSQQTESKPAPNQENPKTNADGHESNMNQEEQTEQDQQVFRLILNLSKFSLTCRSLF